MDKIKYMKLENKDGSYSSSIPLVVDSNHVEVGDNILTNVLNNKASKEDINYLQDEIMGLANGSPKGAYATTEELVSANPDTGVYVITADGHIYNWIKNSNSASDLGNYQALVIDNKSIKPKHTSFAIEIYDAAEDIEWIKDYYWNNGQKYAGSNCWCSKEGLRLTEGSYLIPSGYKNWLNFTYLKSFEGNIITFLNSTTETNLYDSATSILTIPRGEVYWLYITTNSVSQKLLTNFENFNTPPVGKFKMPNLDLDNKDLYKIINYLDINNLKSNYYWDISNTGYLQQKQGSSCSCNITPIELVPGLVYGFTSHTLWNPAGNFCFLSKTPYIDQFKAEQISIPLSSVLDSTARTFVCPEEYKYYLGTWGPVDIMEDHQKMFYNSAIEPSEYIPYGEESKYHYLSNILTETISNEENLIPEIELPNTIYLLDNDLFSIYFENIIKYSQLYKKKTYYIQTHFIKNDGTEIKMSQSEICQVFDYKINILPDRSKYSNFKIRFDIKNIYTNITISTKIINFIVLESTNPSTPITVVTIGDSFTDDFGVSGYQYELFNSKIGNGINMIGTRTTSNINARDDAIAGWNFLSYLSMARDEERNAINPFYDATKSRFNFQYYIDTYYPTTKIDAVIIYLGVNSIVWGDYAYEANPGIVDQAKEMINSILNADDSIKIFLELLTPQAPHDEFLDNYGVYYEKAKLNQEKWNADLLAEFDRDEWINRGVYLLPTNAHFDSRYGIRRVACSNGNALRTNVKFENDEDNQPVKTEYICFDVHPTKVGAQYIADVGKTYLLLAKNI